MELRAHDGVAADDGGHWPAVLRLRDEIASLGCPELERVHEIGVQATPPDRNAVEQRMRLHRIKCVPAHVRDLQARIGRRDAVDLAWDPAEPFDQFVFAPARGHELHADADAEERPALLANPQIERLHHAGNRIEAAPAVRERTDAGQHHAIGAGDLVRIAGHHDRLLVPAFARRTLERLGGRMQIAGAVVDDSDGHRRVPGCGNRPMTSGAAAACRDCGSTVVCGAAPPLLTHTSKNRRSAASRSSATMTPRLVQRRRPSVNRRSVADSMPTRTASNRLAMDLAAAPSLRTIKMVSSATETPT